MNQRPISLQFVESTHRDAEVMEADDKVFRNCKSLGAL